MSWEDFDEYEYFENVAVKFETDLALYCKINGDFEWIPKSVLGADSNVTGMGDVGTLSVQRWFAEQNL